MYNIFAGKKADKSNEYSALKTVDKKQSSRKLRKMLTILLFAILGFGFLPWSQNIRSRGYITTMLPEHRPQTIHSVIPGRIDRWYVREGMEVKKGDTIAFISEVKVAYMDTSLVSRTNNQLEYKKESVEAYKLKKNAQLAQLNNLKEQKQLKLKENSVKREQYILKLEADSLSAVASEGELKIAKFQYERADSLYGLGLKSLVDVEKRRIKYQNAQSYYLKAKNNWLNTKNNLVRNQVERSQIVTDFTQKETKQISDLQTTNSMILNAGVDVNKLENTYANYATRNKFYYILSPQDGYITKSFVTGIGELIKEGQKIVSIMPKKHDLVVEMYVEPIDYPLIHSGEMVQIQFDGWPAIVFSGWPGASYGTYTGEIYAIDQYISDNAKYRVLVKPEESDHKWPDALRYGAGARSMVILNDVPIWYELWRNINGFPPDYYLPETVKKEKKKDEKK